LQLHGKILTAGSGVGATHKLRQGQRQQNMPYRVVGADPCAGRLHIAPSLDIRRVLGALPLLRKGVLYKVTSVTSEVNGNSLQVPASITHPGAHMHSEKRVAPGPLLYMDPVPEQGVHKSLVPPRPYVFTGHSTHTSGSLGALGSLPNPGVQTQSLCVVEPCASVVCPKGQALHWSSVNPGEYLPSGHTVQLSLP
jgi:hypothetical protein